jgi:cobalt/nickel transport system permease protein
MHIPDGFLDPRLSTGLFGAAAIALAYSAAKVREAVTALKPAAALATAGQGAGNIVTGLKRVLTGNGQRLLYVMGMMAALIFAGQMFDFPVLNGTTGHLMGGALAGIILGPFAGALVMAVVLSVQMLFFADGGLLALGANIINMALIGTSLAYYLYLYVKKVAPEWLAIVIAAWASVPLAAWACSIELGFSPALPFTIVSPAMLQVHLIVGLAEALVTLALVRMFRVLLPE